MKQPSSNWRRLLWALVMPRNTDRAEPTVSGMMLVALCFGVGMAAYNSANNILFITLSLLLGSLILSGVLSWLNLRRMDFELRLNAPYRAGKPGTIEVVVRNRKTLLPAHGLWFNLVVERINTAPSPGNAQPKETDNTGRRQAPLLQKQKRITLRQRLAALDVERRQGRVVLGQGLGPGEQRGLVWSWTPPRRGKWRVELEAVGSLFPFGFLKKHLSVGEAVELMVWPAPIPFEDWTEVTATSLQTGRQTKKPGQGSDLLSLRRYEPGDSHRLIHWKASARQRHLMIRQCASEAQEAFALHFQSDERLWPESEAFEAAVRLAATLAENLYSDGRLRLLGVDGDSLLRARRFSDLEGWLDRMAVVMPGLGAAMPTGARIKRGWISFRPQGPKGAAAYVDGRKVTST